MSGIKPLFYNPDQPADQTKHQTEKNPGQCPDGPGINMNEFLPVCKSDCGTVLSIKCPIVGIVILALSMPPGHSSLVRPSEYV